ncbi:MAG: hypothetical protein JWO76_3001 [Nocardioides sp.]|nr:hypothetical protein [Nocardioides sp.]
MKTMHIDFTHRPRTVLHVTLILLMGVSVSILGGALFDRAFSVPADAYHKTVVCNTGGKSSTASTSSCATGPEMTKKYDSGDGDAGNSKGAELPQATQDKIDTLWGQYKQDHPDTTATPWWRGPLARHASCVVINTPMPLAKFKCMGPAGDASIADQFKDVAKLQLTCGAAGIIGFRSGAGIGAAVGAGGCVFDNIVNSW